IQRKIQVGKAPAKAARSRSGQDEGTGAGKKWWERRIPPSTLTEFTLNLATMSDAGIPIVRALNILEGQTAAGPFKRILGDVREEVETGSSLSEAMKKHPRGFDRLYCNMVRAGEAGGVLETILRRLSEFMDRTRRIKEKARGAMVYPAVVCFVAAIVLGVVFVFVIPNFRQIFDSFGITLPASTQFLVNFSDWLSTYKWLILLVILVVWGTFVLLMRSVYRFRRFIHWLLMRLPIVGPMVEKLLIARFTRTFGTLISSGVPHLDALDIVRGSIDNVILGEAIQDVHVSVREGEGIAEPLGESGVFDDMVVNMVDVGEESGRLDDMLLKIADAYEEEADRRIEIFFKILEPALLLVMAVVVGFIVVSLFVPLLAIMDQLGNR
ncbi:MAG: type II secretion system F family protein, partial [Planctomycetes bacterium]|nr:type II secretion system F family protein [Planctomycetota bacterium]